MSRDGKKAMELFESSCKLLDRSYEIGLPCKKDPVNFPQQLGFDYWKQHFQVTLPEWRFQNCPFCSQAIHIVVCSYQTAIIMQSLKEFCLLCNLLFPSNISRNLNISKTKQGNEKLKTSFRLIQKCCSDAFKNWINDFSVAIAL